MSGPDQKVKLKPKIPQSRKPCSSSVTKLASVWPSDLSVRFAWVRQVYLDGVVASNQRVQFSSLYIF